MIFRIAVVGDMDGFPETDLGLLRAIEKHYGILRTLGKCLSLVARWIGSAHLLLDDR
jgi:hypothetical protein